MWSQHTLLARPKYESVRPLPLTGTGKDPRLPDLSGTRTSSPNLECFILVFHWEWTSLRSRLSWSWATHVLRGISQEAEKGSHICPRVPCVAPFTSYDTLWCTLRRGLGCAPINRCLDCSLYRSFLVVPGMDTTTSTLTAVKEGPLKTILNLPTLLTCRENILIVGGKFLPSWIFLF